MSHHCKDCKQKHSLFTDILRARKLKIERQKRIIDRVLQDKMRKIPQLNPQKKFNPSNPNLEALEHYSDSDFSICNSEYKISISRRSKPVRQSPTKTEEEVLNERAKKFVTRLRKQKQYNEGKMLLLRKREQEKRELQAQLKAVQKKSLDLAYKKEKMNRLMESILVHEGKISERAVKSLKKQIRSKTQNWEREDMVKSMNTAMDPTIYTLRARVQELSEIIDSYK